MNKYQQASSILSNLPNTQQNSGLKSNSNGVIQKMRFNPAQLAFSDSKNSNSVMQPMATTNASIEFMQKGRYGAYNSN